MRKPRNKNKMIRQRLYEFGEKLSLRYQIWKTQRQIHNIDDQIYNHDGAISEFGPVSREFSLALSIRRISLVEQRGNLLFQKNRLETRLDSI